MIKVTLPNGKTLPMFRTPISENDLLLIKHKYDRFLLHNVKSGKVRIISDKRPYNYVIKRIDPKPIILGIGVIFSFYKLSILKKKVKKKIEPISNFNDEIKKSAKKFQESMNKMKADKKKKPSIKKASSRATA